MSRSVMRRAHRVGGRFTPRPCAQKGPFEVAIAASADGLPAAELGDVGRVAQLPRGVGVGGCTCSLSTISYWYGLSRSCIDHEIRKQF